MQMVKFPVRATIGRVLINVLMMSDGGQYWGHRTCDTDENDQLNARSVLTTGEPGRGVTAVDISNPIGRGGNEKRSVG